MACYLIKTHRAKSIEHGVKKLFLALCALRHVEHRKQDHIPSLVNLYFRTFSTDSTPPLKRAINHVTV
jgi:hypothetical protein